ncbi:hypothetical protein P154DRAFT_432092 [Amniculicola lignicola CBS 123094]|uniref:Xylanolytic transcriptional activator regulatory domain-containing protein n=1 Tax=Amniculicola lignicola CBS 123094 TaxID=1392246 RepID=A0A6A5WLQ7_9PLEO|nr:hypothetical protein P154DRAFT_432092 [Amniculicola lignicola CBS 123094]
MDTSNDESPSGKKRPCKGFRACWECKRPKMQNSSPNTDASSATSVAAESTDDQKPCSAHIGEQLSKLEHLFEKYVCRKFTPAGPVQQLSRSSTLVDAPEKPTAYFLGLPDINFDARSIPSIGSKITTRRALIALLPSQHDADIIFESTNCWTIMSMYKPAKDVFVNKDRQSYALDMSAIAQEHSIVVARTLLHLAICIGSLPPQFQVSRLSAIWSLDATMENYVTTVTSLVTSCDEQMSTLPGLETLCLLATYHMNSANLRQAWLIIRRALNLAHLMGFHRIITQPTTNPPIESVEAAKFVWRLFVDADRYLGLHLRLPFAAEDYPLPENTGLAQIHRCKLGSLMRQISDLDREFTSQSYVQALALDEKLDSIMKQMPHEFWEVPNVPSTARSEESAQVLERLVTQIWHFQLKIFVHLPFLLRAAKDSRYEFSKLTATQSSRNIIMRWFALRNADITQACCRWAELGVFIATVTIVLDILIEMSTREKAEVQRTRGSDFAMVCRVIAEMEKLAKSSTREKIAARSVIVIKKLISSLDPRRAGTRTRVSIPYFGTIEVGSGMPPTRPAFDLDSAAGKELNTTATDSHLPVFSFVSNDLWPAAGSDCDVDGDLEFDIVLFDGLQDRDTDGNWMF